MGLAFGGPGRYSSNPGAQVTYPAEFTVVPAWAAYLITQNARIELMLARLLEMQGIEMNATEQLEADIAQLVDANTRIVALLGAQSAQIADLQGQLAQGNQIKPEDLAALNDITNKMVAVAGGTATAAAPTPTPEPQAPITSVPVDQAPATEPGPAPIEQQAPVTSAPAETASEEPATTEAATTTDTTAADTAASDSSSTDLSGW
ncbi:hypothetical protein [Nocardia pseudovaccinii]|uniref:hypothetical protein n=1 Tax=Nocardia pseudovaccinii TaxID=189540 RepID=UPI0007A528A5|nr:hypothetical protein [Nocardia pseudovaccinii]